jgi:hypothetical protein
MGEVASSSGVSRSNSSVPRPALVSTLATCAGGPVLRGGRRALPPAASYDVDDTAPHERVRAVLAQQLGGARLAAAFEAGRRRPALEIVAEAAAEPQDPDIYELLGFVLVVGGPRHCPTATVSEC